MKQHVSAITYYGRMVIRGDGIGHRNLGLRMIYIALFLFTLREIYKGAAAGFTNLRATAGTLEAALSFLIQCFVFLTLVSVQGYFRTAPPEGELALFRMQGLDLRSAAWLKFWHAAMGNWWLLAFSGAPFLAYLVQLRVSWWSFVLGATSFVQLFLIANAVGMLISVALSRRIQHRSLEALGKVVMVAGMIVLIFGFARMRLTVSVPSGAVALGMVVPVYAAALSVSAKSAVISAAWFGCATIQTMVILTGMLTAIGWLMHQAYALPSTPVNKAHVDFMTAGKFNPYFAKDLILILRGGGSILLNAVLPTALFAVIYIGASTEAGDSLVLPITQSVIFCIGPSFTLSSSLLKMDLKSLWIKVHGSYKDLILQKFTVATICTFAIATVGLGTVWILFSPVILALFTALGASVLSVSLSIAGTVYAHRNGLLDASRPDLLVMFAVVVALSLYLGTVIYAVLQPSPALTVGMVLPFLGIVAAALLGVSIRWMHGTDL